MCLDLRAAWPSGKALVGGQDQFEPLIWEGNEQDKIPDLESFVHDSYCPFHHMVFKGQLAGMKVKAIFVMPVRKSTMTMDAEAAGAFLQLPTATREIDLVDPLRARGAYKAMLSIQVVSVFPVIAPEFCLGSSVVLACRCGVILGQSKRRLCMSCFRAGLGVTAPSG